MYGDPAPWGPRVQGGRERRPLRRVLALAGVLGLVAVVGVATTGLMLYQRAEDSLTRVPVDGLTEPETAETASSDARHFLVVGSDARDEAADDAALAVDDVEGERSDAILYVSLTDDRDRVSVLSLPRDLVVERNGERMRLGDTFTDGAGELVATVQEELGLPVHHYAHVTFSGFVEAVRTLGGVDICLDEPLVDEKAHADLPAGCQRLQPEDALAFVRSRQGELADFERIERQQRFLRAVVDELTQRRVLSDLPRLFGLVEDVAGNVTTDDRLTLPQMYGIAEEAREVVDGEVPMTSVPAYPDTLGAAEIMRIYEPGARALFEDIREGRQIADRGTAEEREETTVVLWSGGRADELDILGSVLLFGGFPDHQAVGPGPEEFDAGSTTTVHARSDDKPAAERVAALLGAPVRELPEDVELPDGADVVVAVGRDASSTGTLPGTLPEPGARLETQEAEDGSR